MTDRTKELSIATSNRLAYLAAQIALETPIKRNMFAHCAYVRWQIVEEIRAALDEAGFDWRRAHETAAAYQRARQERPPASREEPAP